MAAAEPIVIAHRGASAYRPEHTLAAYRLAIEMGADYIEPDLVSTSDGVLVARHENEISGTTDVAGRLQFAERHATKEIDGRTVSGWFTEDFTLAELKTLRARERLPEARPANTEFDGRYEIPTFREVLALAAAEGVGVYPETKHPAYYDALGLSLEEPLLAALEEAGLAGDGSPVFIQSFDPDNLPELRGRTRLPLVRLVGTDTPELVTAEGLRAIGEYADAVGPHKALIAARPQLVDDAHRAGLLVHPYTFRPEDADQPAELEWFYRLGVDGVFADNPDIAVAVRERVLRATRRV